MDIKMKKLDEQIDSLRDQIDRSKELYNRYLAEQRLR